MSELHKQMEAKLGELGIPAESIKVFGAIRTNVHVVCVGRDTAQRWATAIAQVLKAKPYVGEHLWEAAVNHNTVMKPTMRRGFLVAAAS